LAALAGRGAEAAPHLKIFVSGPLVQEAASAIVLDPAATSGLSLAVKDFDGVLELLVISGHGAGRASSILALDTLFQKDEKLPAPGFGDDFRIG
jgi:hypothetical protein